MYKRIIFRCFVNDLRIIRDGAICGVICMEVVDKEGVTIEKTGRNAVTARTYLNRTVKNNPCSSMSCTD